MSMIQSMHNARCRYGILDDVKKDATAGRSVSQHYCIIIHHLTKNEGKMCAKRSDNCYPYLTGARMGFGSVWGGNYFQLSTPTHQITNKH
jgi:hypothetical protein